jgi:hypothetical protein
VPPQAARSILTKGEFDMTRTPAIVLAVALAVGQAFAQTSGEMEAGLKIVERTRP